MICCQKSKTWTTWLHKPPLPYCLYINYIWTISVLNLEILNSHLSSWIYKKTFCDWIPTELSINMINGRLINRVKEYEAQIMGLKVMFNNICYLIYRRSQRVEWYNDIHFYYCHMNTLNQSKTIGEFYNFTFMLKIKSGKKKSLNEKEWTLIVIWNEVK